MSDKEKTMTSIQVSQATKERLMLLGLKGDTYDVIVRRLLDKHSKGKK